MPAPRYRSRSLRRVFKKITKGVKLVYKKRKPKKKECSVTGSKLSGVKREIHSKIRSLNKSQKRPERPYGGVLSPTASRREIIKRHRK
jgi:large subunit ribosomal protein L34e